MIRSQHPVKTAPVEIKYGFRIVTLLLITLSLQACVVFTIADVAASAVVKTAGLVVDGAIGTVRVVGGVVGSVLPGGGDDKNDAKDSKDNRDKKK
jgi:hypothetical protein